MLKRLLTTLLILLIGTSAFAAENYLSSIVIEKNDFGTAVLLRSDEIAKIKKESDGSDRLILTLKNMKQSSAINTLYKNSADVTGLIVQNEGNNLKIYVEAKDISKAQVIFETPNSAPITVSDTKSEGKFIWSVVSLMLLLIATYSAKNISTEPKKKDINEIIKEREKALYRNFQREVATLPSMSYKLKSYSKHVLKGETIRSYESRMSRL